MRAVSDRVHQLLATDVALDKLGGRGISAAEAEQLLHNRHTTVANPRRGSEPREACPGDRQHGRWTTILTLGIERTVDPTSWLIVTGWSSTQTERKMLDS